MTAAISFCAAGLALIAMGIFRLAGAIENSNNLKSLELKAKGIEVEKDIY